MKATLAALRKKYVIGFLGGSDLNKILEQLQSGTENGECLWVKFLYVWSKNLLALDEFDYGFAENGLTAYKLGKHLPSHSFIEFLGEEKYKKLVNFCLHYIADLDLPIKRYCISFLSATSVVDTRRLRGTFIEFRKGMVNISPIGRNAT